jgi:hypothetical protein
MFHAGHVPGRVQNFFTPRDGNPVALRFKFNRHRKNPMRLPIKTQLLTTALFIGLGTLTYAADATKITPIPSAQRLRLPETLCSPCAKAFPNSDCS